MHLTNYAINKHNENFVQDDMTGSKRYCLVHVPQCPVHILQESCTWDTGLLPSFLGQTCYHRSALIISCPPHRKLSTLNAWMTDNSYNTTKLWEDIEDIIIKTLISAHPVVKHNYQSCFPNHTTGCACFEILGFDILVDRKLKPWLLEVRKESPPVLKQLWKQQTAKSWLVWGMLQNKGWWEGQNSFD